MNDADKYVANCKTLALRLFKSRHEVKDDWHWRSRRRAQIRGYIHEVRTYEKLQTSAPKQEPMVTVLYHIENHRDRLCTIIGVFDDKAPPGSGRINRAIDAAIALRTKMGIKCTRSEFHLAERILNEPEVAF